MAGGLLAMLCPTMYYPHSLPAPSQPLLPGLPGAEMLQRTGPRELLRPSAEVTTQLFPHQMEALAWMVGGGCVGWG